MPNFIRSIAIVGISIFFCACTSYQPTKNVWKGTKELWASYVSPSANIDYEDKGELEPQQQTLSKAMIGVDNQLGKLERVMHNADRPPTVEWMERLFQSFPWVSGFAGVKYDGTILGQEPADSLKNLDFNYLLHEDSKQRSRALRADVQPSELGPEIMLASPLYDGIDFLGLVVTYFDMRNLMTFSDHPQDIVVLCPTALLWPGKYDFAATPLAGVDWNKVVRESTAGTCSNSNGTFFYQVRYLANLPLVFAIPQKGEFQTGSGGIEQGFAYFPKEREKGTPPPVSEERLKREAEARAQAEQAAEENRRAQAAMETREPGPSPNDLEAGSGDSILLRKAASAPARKVEERNLEGENVPVERVQRQRRRPKPVMAMPEEELAPEPAIQPDRNFRLPSPFGPHEEEPTPVTRPSPFGPKEEEPVEEPVREYRRPSPFGPVEESAPAPVAAPSETTVKAPAPSEPQASGGATPEASKPAEKDVENSTQREPELLPGGRISPFGPKE